MLAKLWKQNIVLFVLLGVYGIASIYVYQQSGIFIHRAIVWNLFLALLPYTCMTLFFLFAQKQKHLGMGLSFLAWLLLFPNVPYLITDMIHISPLTFYIFQEEGSVYVRSLLPWLELLHLMSGILFGLAVGYRSFYCLHRYGERHWGKGISWSIAALVILVSSYGVYLGRFLRLNSWDILRPQALIEEIMDHNDGFALQFTLMFALFLLVTYAFYYSCYRKKETYTEHDFPLPNKR